MDLKGFRPDKDLDLDNGSSRNCGQALYVETKRSPLKKYIAVFIVIMVLSFATTASRLRGHVLPSTAICLFNISKPLVLPGGHRGEESLVLPEVYRLKPVVPRVRRVEESFSCNHSDNRTSICRIQGDVRLVSGKSTSIILYSCKQSTWHGGQDIRPYPRQFDPTTMEHVQPVTLKSIFVDNQHDEFEESSSLAECSVYHAVPAVVFSTLGYAGNPYHDFQDVLIPLYITSRHLNGEVVFVITESRQWWLEKFGAVFKQLSNHDIIYTKTDSRVHCFVDVTVGLSVHGELDVNPALMSNNVSIQDLQTVLHRAFGEMHEVTVDNLFRLNETGPCHVGGRLRCKPKLAILARNGSRAILNLPEVVKLARKEGFEVQVIVPSGETKMSTMYRALRTSDVMMGVHGAALAHLIFMRPRSVFIQIVPLGADWPAVTFYGDPAMKNFGLQYIAYQILPDESSLRHSYDINHPVLQDPEEVIARNWETRKNLYLQGQSVTLSLTRFQLTLHVALQKALEAFPGCNCNSD